jgi:hypothetical protein
VSVPLIVGCAAQLLIIHARVRPAIFSKRPDILRTAKTSDGWRVFGLPVCFVLKGALRRMTSGVVVTAGI